MGIYQPLCAVLSFHRCSLHGKHSTVQKGTGVSAQKICIMSYPDYFTSHPEWTAFATKHGYSLPSPTNSHLSNPIEPTAIDIIQARAREEKKNSDFIAKHPLESLGYKSHFVTVNAPDGADLSVKISFPNASRLEKGGTKALPVLFVTHGGGWIEGSHTSEEAWLLWPLYTHFDLAIVSVEYRMAPEHRFPTWIEDSWSVLKKLLSRDEMILSRVNIQLDLEKVILAGSSAGATISAVLSQRCRDEELSVFGVVLNVPVLCDYRHFPVDYEGKGRVSSYAQGIDAYLSSGVMAWVWNIAHPSSASGSDPKASPLLGTLAGLPRHLVFIAGQDCLRDEGMDYAIKLKKVGVEVDLHVYPGVPHTFSQFWELTATRKFWEDFRDVLGRWLSS